MTIGISVLCDRGSVAVVASDMRSSYPRSAIQPHDWTGKQWDFDVPFPVIACVAGTLGICQPVVDELNNRLRKLPRKASVYCEHIENAIRDARSRTFRRYADWRIRMSYGMTLMEWQRGKVPGGKMNKLIHDEVARFIDGLQFRVELLVAGFLTNGDILFYKASGKRYIEGSASPGVYVIGTGGRLAMAQLNKRKQSIEYGLPRTLLHIAESMDEAQTVEDKSVGKPSSFTIAWRDGRVARINPEAPIFRDWKAAYKGRESTASLDGSEIAARQVAAALQEHIVERSNAQNPEG